MPLAINIRADNSSAGEIERLWDQVGAFEDEPSMRALGYPPHFTFVIYDTPEVDRTTAWNAMQTATMGERQLQIEFRKIRWFEEPSLVLWAEPPDDEVLRRLHGSINAVIDPAHCRPHYRPGAWTPHCTLGTRYGFSRSSAGPVSLADIGGAGKSTKPTRVRRHSLQRFE